MRRATLIYSAATLKAHKSVARILSLSRTRCANIFVKLNKTLVCRIKYCVTSAAATIYMCVCARERAGISPANPERKFNLVVRNCTFSDEIWRVPFMSEQCGFFNWPFINTVKWYYILF